MRTTTHAALWVTLGVLLAAPLPARALDGTLKLGGVIRNQTGDRSTVQETFNVFDGFAVTQIRLDGPVAPGQYLDLDVRDANLESRRVSLAYRLPGTFQFTGGYQQHRQVFSPDGAVDARRRDWKVGSQYSPTRWLSLSGAFDSQTRDGDRLPYPLGSTGVLGTRYDNALRTGEVTADVHGGRRGAAVTYRASGYTDDLDGGARRTGQVVSARLYMPCAFTSKLTHLLRAAYGTSRLSGRDLDVTLASFQYTGVLQPVDALQVRYAFESARTDAHATRLRTDRIQNSLDASWIHRFGQLSGGYAYETNDDDRSLTSYNTWRGGAILHAGKVVDAKFDVTSRVKKDQEELTLLKDLDASQLRARLQVRPYEPLTLGAGYARRERDFTDLHVDLKGDVLNTFAHWTLPGWGELSGDFSASRDDGRDLSGGFHTRSRIVTARLDVERIRNVRLAGGVTWLDYRRDLDQEKSLGFAEGVFTLRDAYHLEVRYNVYNFDDYIQLSRYYTANVLRIDLAYDFHLR